MVFQRPNPLPISIYENVLFGIRVHTPRRTFSRDELDEMVESALRDVQLWDDVKDMLRKKATQPDAGAAAEAVHRAAAAAEAPRDPDGRALLGAGCRGHRADRRRWSTELRERYTIVMVTHNMGQARRVSQECIFMLLGRIVEHGETLDVFLNPKHKDTEMYVTGRYG